MELQTYYNFVLTRKSAGTYAATDAHNPTDVYELMVVLYKRVVEVLEQQIPRNGHSFIYWGMACALLDDPVTAVVAVSQPWL